MHLKKPKATANIFSSGKLVCLGTKDEQSARIATRRIARMIQKGGFPVKFLNYRVVNIVGSTQLFGFRLNFEKFYYDNLKNVFYNPETFPGMYYTSKDYNITATIFRNGKVTLTNAKTVQQLNDGYAEIYEKIIKSST
jgi:transcription initiation factor TFIID TATA-box-binding protein